MILSRLLFALALLEVEDYYRIESADEPAISPDGRLVAFTRRAIDEEGNRRRSELWLSSASEQSRSRRLSIPGFDASSPRFSPDGKWLTFRSTRVSETSSVWFFRTDGFGEAFQVKGIEEVPVFSPDGKYMAYTRKTPSPDPRPEPSAREKKIEERFAGKMYDWLQFRYDGRGYLPDPTDLNESPPLELYLASTDDPEGAEHRRLTCFGFDVAAIAWSPDAERLVLVADSHQRDEYIYERPDLWLIERKATSCEAKRLTDDGFANESPVFSPDGRRIAFLREKGLSLLIQEKADRGAPLDVYVMDFESGRMTNVTAAWDLRPGAPFFSPDGEHLYFEAEVSGGNHLFRAPADGADGVNGASGESPVSQVTSGERQLSGFSFTRDFTTMAYAAGSGSEPSDVFLAATDGSGERRLSSFGRDSVAGYSLGAPETIQYKSKDGTSIEGFVLLPPGYDPKARRYPFLLAIHGGPHGAYGHEFSFELQLWAAKGYVVLYANPRGSTGYGEDFLWATWGGGWGNLDSEDVLAGVDFARSKYAIDEARMGVTGYSYGGFLTNWILTHDHRFAAAISGAGISNWVSDYGTADIPRTKESEFYGPPWEDEGGSLLQRQSPMNYIANVRTPTLFIHGESDFRVPIEQGEQMYTAFKKLKVDAKFIRYPDSYHGGWKPWNVVHRYQHELLWWDRYLGSP
ncbi:MAG TPA: S9 family peptidase [Vicinamibacteria bacterium]|nr:S9 family peptidase [Vicinamibacteria bacterium]